MQVHLNGDCVLRPFTLHLGHQGMPAFTLSQQPCMLADDACKLVALAGHKPRRTMSSDAAVIATAGG